MIEKQSLYRKFKSLLLYFLEGIYIERIEESEPVDVSPEEFAKQCDRETTQQFIRQCTQNSVAQAISEGREVLALEKFPADWIQDVTNRYPFNKGVESTDQDYYEWVKWIIDTLEEEAKRSAKL